MLTTNSLALVSNGAPIFASALHVGRPNIGNKESFLERVNEAFDRRWLTNDGPFNKEFEARLAEYLGVKHVVTMCNATVALEIAVRALDMEGEVIVPSFTFVASAHALQWQGITPVFCDIDSDTHNIDPQRVEALITPRTTGIVGVHVWGRACDIDALEEISQKHKLPLLFDAAHAFGCSSGDRMIGNFGAAEVFSFHATKFFNSFEGGAVATNDSHLAEKMRLMRNFGFSDGRVIYLGTNGKMSEVSAAMGLTSLESINDFISVNRQNYHTYMEELNAIPGVKVCAYDESNRNNFQYIVVEIDEFEAGLSRDTLVEVLRAENVLARRYFYPGVHQMEPYCSYFPHAGLLLPRTEVLTERVMSLPTGTAVNTEVVRQICDIIRQALHDPLTVTTALQRRYTNGQHLHK